MIPVQANTPGARFLVMGASFVIVVAGLREGATILLPFALALFLAVLSMPFMFWLQLRRVPAPLAIALTMLVIGALFGALIMLATQAVADLQNPDPRLYDERTEPLRAMGSRLECLERNRARPISAPRLDRSRYCRRPFSPRGLLTW